MTVSTTPILYSFRRCPYAMRARMAIHIAQTPVRLREVVLRDKPAEMLAASPKGTVPVLVLPGGRVIDESLDIMSWALAQNDPEGWLNADPAETQRLVDGNDRSFKHHLDRYKYPNRYPDDPLTAEEHRGRAAVWLTKLDVMIGDHGGQVCGPEPTLADIAMFPFIRQFANTDRNWFDRQPLPHLQRWLNQHLDSILFKTVMPKWPQWTSGDPEPVLGNGQL